MPKISPKRKLNEKWCCGCRRFLSTSNFHKSKRRKDGLTSWCNSCVKRYEKEYAPIRKINYEKRVSNVNYLTFWEWKVKRNKLSVSAKQLQQLYLKNPNCYYCAVSLNHRQIHIDHKMPRSRNGIEGMDNLVISCPDCNRLKHTRSEQEFKNFLKEYCLRVNNANKAESESYRERLSEKRGVKTLSDSLNLWEHEP
jgi:5-methylcytosine-specific restriction endonuclease McrA